MSRDIEYKYRDGTQMYSREEAKEQKFYVSALEDNAYGRKRLQYTGLKDKNGKKIYEGDVIYIAGTGNVQVSIKNGCTYFGDQLCLDCYAEQEVGEIVGNLYENPDLLAESKHD